MWHRAGPRGLLAARESPTHPHRQRDHPQPGHQHKPAVPSLCSAAGRCSLTAAAARVPEPGPAAPALQWGLPPRCPAEASSAPAPPLLPAQAAQAWPCKTMLGSMAAWAECAAGVCLPLLGRVPVRPRGSRRQPPAPFSVQAGAAGLWDKEERFPPGDHVPRSSLCCWPPAAVPALSQRHGAPQGAGGAPMPPSQ